MYKHSIFTLSALSVAVTTSQVQAQSLISPDVVNEVVVTATRTEKPLLETPAAVSVQNMEYLQQKGFVYGADEFRGVPGMFVRRGEGDGEEFPFISIRGITGNHGNDTFLAMIDGIPFVGPDEEVLLYQLPYAVVQNVEIVRGPVSALYGRGAISGAVNYRTREPTRDNSQLRLSAGDDGYTNAEWLYEESRDNGSFLLSASRLDYEGWRENSERELSNLFMKGQLDVGDGGSLSTYFNYFDRDAEVPSTIPTLEDGTIVDVIGGDETFAGFAPSYNKQRGWITALSYEHPINNNLNLRVTGQYRNFDSEVRLDFYDFFEFDPANNILGINGFHSPNDTNVLYGEATLNWQTGRHNIVAGISAEETDTSEFDEWTGQNGFTFECGFKFFAVLIDYSTGQVLNQDHPCFVTDQRQVEDEASNSFLGVYIQDEIELNENFTLTLGGRFDTFERDVAFTRVGGQAVNLNADGDESNFAPKASLAYNYDGGMVYVSYGEGFNSNFGPLWQWDPDRYERVEKPTIIDSYELGWKGTLGDYLQWETAIFHMEQENRRTFIDNPDPMGAPTLATTGQLYSSSGLEAGLRITPSDSTRFTINYTYLDPEWDEFVVSSFAGPLDFSGTTPQGVPDQIFSIDAEHRPTERLKIGFAYEWYDDYFITVDNRFSGGSYDLVTLFGSYKLSQDRDWFLDLTLTNAFDEDYYHFFGGSRTAVTNVTPGAPRQVRASLRMDF